MTGEVWRDDWVADDSLSEEELRANMAREGWEPVTLREVETDFFEEDEPVEDVRAAFARGVPVVTVEPPRHATGAVVPEELVPEARRLERARQRAAAPVECPCGMPHPRETS